MSVTTGNLGVDLLAGKVNSTPIAADDPTSPTLYLREGGGMFFIMGAITGATYWQGSSGTKAGEATIDTGSQTAALLRANAILALDKN
jgi:hypothetical protein